MQGKQPPNATYGKAIMAGRAIRESELVETLLAHDKMVQHLEGFVKLSGGQWSANIRRTIVTAFLRYAFFGEIEKAIYTDSDAWQDVEGGDINS